MKKIAALALLAALALALSLALAAAIPMAPVLAAGAPAWHGGYAPYVAAYQAVENGGRLPETISEGFAQRHSAFLGTMKYALHDINGNGSPELIVGISEDFTQYYACDVYTIDSGTTSLLISGGWESIIVVNTRSISYGESHIVECDDEYSLSSDGDLILEYRLEYDYESDSVVSETGARLNDTPADLDWKPLSEYANELSASQGSVPSTWAANEVEAAISAGLVPAGLRQGYQSPVSRGSVAQMFIDLIERSSGQPVDALLAAKGAAIDGDAFVDTGDKAVLAANALGIINGVGNSRFDPDGTLTRAQVAAIINRIARALGTETDGYSHQFADVGGHWVSAELGWPVHCGIIYGVGDDRFDPDAELTTEQAIMIVGRALAPLKDAAASAAASAATSAAANEAGNEETDAATDQATDEMNDDIFDLYESLVAEWKRAMDSYKNDDTAENDMLSFHFYDGAADTDSLKAYYALYDLDGNGTAELILRKQSKYEDIIAYIFALKDGIPINVFGYYDSGSDEGKPREVPWSRVGSSRILANGLIDSADGDYSIYKIAEDGYSVIKVATAEPHGYPDQAGLAEAEWRYYVNDVQVDYSIYEQYLAEEVYTANENDALSPIDWINIDV